MQGSVLGGANFARASLMLIDRLDISLLCSQAAHEVGGLAGLVCK